MNDKAYLKQDINFLEYPLWSPDRRDKKHIYEIQTDKGLYVYKAQPDNIPNDTDAIFLYYFLSIAQANNVRELEFNFHQVLKKLRMQPSVRNYQRLEASLMKWSEVSVYFEGAFFSQNKSSENEKKYTTKTFHVLKYEKTETIKKRKVIKYNLSIDEDFFKTTRDSLFTRNIDLDRLIDLGTPIARRLDEWLPKQFIKKNKNSHSLNSDLLLKKLRINCNPYPSEIKRRLNTIQTEIKKLNKVYDNYKYSMNFVLKQNKPGIKPKKYFLVTFFRDIIIKIDKPLKDYEYITIDDYYKYIHKIEKILNNDNKKAKIVFDSLYKDIEKNLLRLIKKNKLETSEKNYIEKTLNKVILIDEDKATLNIYLKNIYKKNKKAELLKTKKLQQKEIEKLKDLYTKMKDEKINKIIENFSKEQTEKIEKDFAKSIKSKPIIYGRYKKEGLKNVVAYGNYITFITTHYLDEVEQDFILWVKKYHRKDIIKTPLEDSKYIFKK